MKRILPGVCILLFTSCSISEPISRDMPQNNQTYTVDYLFEHDGCKVYRFYDCGGYVYFTNCNGLAVSGPDSSRTYNTTTTGKTKYQQPPNNQ